MGSFACTNLAMCKNTHQRNSNSRLQHRFQSLSAEDEKMMNCKESCYLSWSAAMARRDDNADEMIEQRGKFAAVHLNTDVTLMAALKGHPGMSASVASGESRDRPNTTKSTRNDPSATLASISYCSRRLLAVAMAVR